MPRERPPLLDPNPPPPDDSERMLELIERLSWRAARAKDRWGRPQIPHEYFLRNSYLVATKGAEPDEQAEADYVALHAFIQEHGRTEKFSRATRLYLYPGDDRKYWAMSQIETSGVINRMWIADDIERLRKSGQIE